MYLFIVDDMLNIENPWERNMSMDKLSCIL